MADGHQDGVTARAAALRYPTNVEDITHEWLAQAVAVNNPDVIVKSAVQDRIIWGTATKAFFKLEYEGGAGARDLPAKVCVKGNFDERMRNYYDLDTLFIVESAFYRDLAPKLDAPLPRCVLGAENGKDGVVILEDLGGGGIEFGDPTKPWTPDQAIPILNILASLHAVTWGWKAGQLPWVTLGSRAQRDGLTAMMSGDRFDTLTVRPEVMPHMPKGYRDRERALAGLAALWRHDDASQHLAAGHGDAHIGQTYIDTDGRRGLLDWQSVAVMPWSKDVTYFITGVLDVEERRRHELDLLEYYLKALEANGGPKLDRAYAKNEYAIQTYCGIVWPVVTEQMQSIANVAAMSERHLAAMNDWQPLAKLGV